MKSCVAVLMSILFYGCGVSFSPVQMTSELPDTFKSRNVYPDKSGILKYKLAQLVGSVIYQEPGATHYDLKKIVLKNSYKPSLEMVKEEDGQVFEGTVDRGAGVNGSYLGFAASLDTKEVATFSVRDRSIVFVDNTDVPWDVLLSEAKAPKPNPATRRYWIQGALLASLDVSRFTEISSSASAVVGATFGAEGKVYNKAGQEIHDYKISIHLVDLDKLADRAPETFAILMSDTLKANSLLTGLHPTGLTLLKFRESDLK